METIRDHVAKMTKRQLDAQAAATAHARALAAEAEKRTGAPGGTGDAGTATVSTEGR